MDTIHQEGADPHDAIRAEVRQIMAMEGLKQTDVAREAGIPYGTFTPFMGGTYRGDNNEKAEQVQRWLETRRQTRQTATVLPQAPSYILTPTAEAVTSVLAYSHAAPDFGVVVGGAGIGKTTAIEEYQRRNSNVWIWTAEPSLGSINNMLSGIADEMGITQGQASRLSRSITARVKGASGLLVVDEAQHLQTPALDQLRTIQDKGRCGIVVSGNESLLARLKGGQNANDHLYAQLHSRVGMRMTQPKSRARDICMMVEAWGVFGEAETKLLKAIARKPGALRILTKVIRLASMLANGSQTPVGIEHIRNAYNQLSSTPIDEAP